MTNAWCGCGGVNAQAKVGQTTVEAEMIVSYLEFVCVSATVNVTTTTPFFTIFLSSPSTQYTQNIYQQLRGGGGSVVSVWQLPTCRFEHHYQPSKYHYIKEMSSSWQQHYKSLACPITLAYNGLRPISRLWQVYRLYKLKGKKTVFH